MSIYQYLHGHESEKIKIFLVITIYLLTAGAHITTDILRKFNWSTNKELVEHLSRRKNFVVNDRFVYVTLTQISIGMIFFN